MIAPSLTAAAVQFSGDDFHQLSGPPSGTSLNGRMKAATKVLAQDNGVITGLWECEPGLARWEFVTRGEFVYILSGRGVTISDDGSETVLEPGVAATFPIGWKGTWRIDEQLRKVFVVFPA